MTFFVLELDAFKPGSAVVTFARGHGTHTHGALARLPDAVAASGTILASDMGYRTLESDPSGLVVYPPIVNQAFTILRAVNLDPAGNAAGAGAGQIRLANSGGRFDSIAATWNSDGRALRVYRGEKTHDLTRDYMVDPSYTTLVLLFAGMATPWFLSDTELVVPVRDATYWLEQPIQATQYLGTGTLEGPAALLGQPKPKTRGAAFNVTPTLVDPAFLIYQYTDARGTVAALYEGGSTTYAFSSDTTNLYAGTTASGHYRTDNSRGLFQLGSSPTYAITADVTGEFPVAGAITNPATIARYLLAEDAALPAGNIDVASFTAAAAAYAYSGGVNFAPTDSPSGVDAVSRILASFGALLVPKRNGSLSCFVLRAIAPGVSAVAAFGLQNVVSLTPTSLPPGVDPPPFRWRVGYQHNYTSQTSGLNPTVPAARAAILAASDQYAGFASGAVLTAYKRPTDPAPVGGGLSVLADAQAVANALGALWSVRRRLYTMTVPVALGMLRDIGDVISLTWPMDNLASGQLGQIVGEQFNSADSTIAFTVLV